MDQTKSPEIQRTEDMFADATAGGGETSPETLGAPATDVVSRAEFNKVVGQRQTAKEKVRQLTAQVDQLMSRLGRADQQDESQVAPEGQAGDSREADFQAIERELAEPVRARISELRGRKETLEKRLTDLLADQELRVAATRAHAINPDQVVALLRGRVQMIETADGRFESHFVSPDGQTALDGDKPFSDAQRFVDAFLAQPENTNLLRSTVTPGSGARPAGGAMTYTEPMPRSKAEFMALPPAERLAVANRMTRRQRDSILGRASADHGDYL